MKSGMENYRELVRKVPTAPTVGQQMGGNQMSLQSITPEQAIAREANDVIRSLYFTTPASRDSVEAALDSLHAVASSIAPTVAKHINVRLIALRNRIHVPLIQQGA